MLFYPKKCLRGLNTCRPLSQIVGGQDGDVISFFCCGENDGTDRPIEEDKYTVCFKGEFRDQVSYNDKRDLVHNMAVLAQALAHIEEDEG